MKTRKFTALISAGLLAVAMATPTYAAETPVKIESLEGGVTGYSVVAEGTTVLPTINVEMPTSHTFKINPYEIGGTEDSPIESQINSTVAAIVNKSDIAIDVELKSAAVTFGGAAKTKASLVTKAAIETSTAKGVYIELLAEVAEAGADGTESNAYPEFSTEESGNAVAVPITAKVTATKLGTIEAAEYESGALKSGGSVSTLYLKYDGETVTNPAAGWAKDDAVNVSSVYTFKVAVPEKEVTR